MLRREVLAGLAAFAAMPSQAEQLPLAAAEPFSASTVRDLAASLAAKAYAPPLPVNEAWTSISYDDYVSIWFDERRALFQDSDAPLRVDLFLTALYYPHAIGLSVVENGQSRKVEFSLDAFDRTGPEMEAMSAASTAALTVYDMCKAIDRSMEILDLRLEHKSGGKSGDWYR